MPGIRSLYNRINSTGFCVNIEKLNELLREVDSENNRCLCTLMDKGYLSQCKVIDDKEIRKVLIQEFDRESCKNLFNSLTGEIELSVESITLVKNMNKKNSAMQEFLSLLLEYYRTSQLSLAYHKIKTNIKTGDKVYPNFTATQLNMGNDLTELFDNVEVLDILKLDQKSYLYRDVRYDYYKEFLRFLDISLDIIEKHKAENKGILFKELTFIEELESLKFITDYKATPTVIGDTTIKYNRGKRLYSSSGREGKIYVERFINDILVYMQNEIPANAKVFLATRNCIIFEKINKTQPISVVRDENYKKYKVDNEIEYKKFWENAGAYVYNYGENMVEHIVNQLFGNTGEYISREYINRRILRGLPKEQKEKFLEDLIPTRVYTYSYKNGLVVSTKTMYNTKYFSNIETVVGNLLELQYDDFSSCIERLKTLTNSPSNDVSEIYRCLVKQYESDFKEYIDDEYYKTLICDLILCIVHVNCGVKYNSFIKKDENLKRVYENDFYMFVRASYEAERFLEEYKIMSGGS